MTSAVAIKQRKRVAWVTPLSADDHQRVAAMCGDETIVAEIERRRAGAAVTPDQVSARDLIKTMNALADKLNAAADALESLPHTARALLQEQTGGAQLQQRDRALDLRNLAALARKAARHVTPQSGRPPNRRLLYAVDSANALCARFKLPLGNIPELASIIFGAPVSEDACKRARRHRRKPA